MEMDFHSMKRKELQALCKKHSIAANLSNREMADLLTLIFKENEKPISRGPSCLKNLSEVASENGSKVVTKKVKKVRFSPENQTIEYTANKQAGRKSRRKSVLKRPSEVIENSGKIDLSGKIVDGLVRITRSRAQKVVEGDVNIVLSPPVGKKRGRRDAKVGSVQVENADGFDKLVHVAELGGGINVENVDDKVCRGLTRRQLRSSGVVIDQGGERDRGDVLVSRKDMRRRDSKTARNGKCSNGVLLLDEISEDSFFAGEDAKPKKISKRSKQNATEVENSISSSGIGGKNDVVGRITRSRAHFEEKVFEVESKTETVEGQEDHEKVLQLEEPSAAPGKESVNSKSLDKDGAALGKVLRQSKRKDAKVQKSGTLSGNLRKNENAGRITRSRAQSVGNASAVESESVVFEVQEEREEVVLLEEPSKDLGRKACRRISVVPQKGKVGGDDPRVKRKSRKQCENNYLDEAKEVEATVEVRKENEKVSLPNVPPRRSRRNTVIFNHTASTGGDLGTHETVGRLNQLRESRSEKDAFVTEEPLRRSSRNASRNNTITTANEVDGIVKGVGKDGQLKQKQEPILKPETPVTKGTSLIEIPQRRFTHNASKSDLMAPAGLSGEAVEEQQQSRSRMPVIVDEAPFTEGLSTLKEAPIDNAGLTVPETDGNKIDWDSNKSKQIIESYNKKRKGYGRKSSAKKRLASVEVSAVHAEIEEVSDKTINFDDTPIPTSVKLQGAFVDKERQNSASESVVVVEKEGRLVGDNKETLFVDDTVEGDMDDQSCWSINRRTDFDDDNLLEPEPTESQKKFSDVVSPEIIFPVVGFLRSNESDYAGEPSNLLDLEKGLQTEELPTAQSRNSESDSVDDHPGEDEKSPVQEDWNTVQFKDACRISEPLIPEVVMEDHLRKVSESRGSQENSDNDTEKAEKISAIDPSDLEGIAEGENIVPANEIQELTSESHLVIAKIAAEMTTEIQLSSSDHVALTATPLRPALEIRNTCQLEAQDAVQSTMLERSHTSHVGRREYPSYETEISDETTCTTFSKAGDGIFGQFPKEKESVVSERNSDNISEDIIEKCVHELSDGGILLVFPEEKDTEFIEDTSTANVALQSPGIADKGMPSSENLHVKVNNYMQAFGIGNKKISSCKGNLSMDNNLQEKSDAIYSSYEEANDVSEKGIQAEFGDCCSEKRAKVKVIADSNSGKAFVLEESSVLSSTELVLMKIDDAELVGERNISADIFVDLPFSKDSIEPKDISGKGTKGEMDIEQCDCVVNEENTVCAAEIELGGHSDCQKLAAQGNDSAESSSTEAICKESDISGEKAFEMMVNPAECIESTHILKLGKTGTEDRNSDAMVIDVGALEQVIDKHLDEEEMAEVHGGNLDDDMHRNSAFAMDKATHMVILERMNLQEAENEGTLLASPTERRKVFLNPGDKSADISGAASWVLNEVISADCDVLEETTDEIVGTVMLPDEANFGDLDVQNEGNVADLDRSASNSSDNLISVDGKAADRKENIGIMDSDLNSKGNSSNAEKEDNVDGTTLVTSNDIGVHLVEGAHLDVNSSDHNVIIKHDCGKLRVAAADEAGVVQAGNLLANASFGSPGTGSSSPAVSHLNFLSSYGEKCESHVYSKVISNDAEGKEMIYDNRGKNAMEMDFPFQKDDEVTVDKTFGAQKVKIPAFRNGIDCFTLDKLSHGNRSKNNTKEAEETLTSLELNDTFVGGDNKEFSDFENLQTVSPLKPKICINCSVSPAAGAGSPNHGITENKALDFHVESAMFTSREINMILGDGEQVEVEKSDGGSLEVSLINQGCKDSVVGKEDIIIIEQVNQVAEKQLGEVEHQSHLAVSNEPICDSGEGLDEQHDIPVIMQEYTDCENHKNETAEVENCYVSKCKLIVIEAATFDGGNNAATVNVMAECGQDNIKEAEIMASAGLRKIYGNRGVAGDKEVYMTTKRTDLLEEAGIEDTCADCKVPGKRSNEFAGTKPQLDEVKLGHLDGPKEVEPDRSISMGSDAFILTDSEIEDRKEKVETTETKLNVKYNNSEADTVVTPCDIIDHLIEEESALVNDSSHEVIVDHACEKINVADGAGVAIMDGKTGSEANEVGNNWVPKTPFSQQILLSGNKWEGESSAETKLSADTFSGKPEISSISTMVSWLNAPASCEEYEPHKYSKDVSNDTEGKVANADDRGNDPTDVGLLFQDDKFTIGKRVMAQKGNEDLSYLMDGFNMENNLRDSQEVAKEQLDEHKVKVNEVAFMDDISCLAINRPLCDNKGKSHVIETVEVDDSHKLDHDFVTAGDSNEVNFEDLCAVSPLKREMVVECSLVSPVRASSDYENKSLEYHVESHLLTHWDTFLGDRKHDEVENSDARALKNDHADGVKENVMIIEQIAKEQLGEHEHQMADEVSELKCTRLVSHEPIYAGGEGSKEQDVSAVIHRSIDGENYMDENFNVESCHVLSGKVILIEAGEVSGGNPEASYEQTAGYDPSDLKEDNTTNPGVEDVKSAIEMNRSEDMGEAMELSKDMSKLDSTLVDQSPAFTNPATDIAGEKSPRSQPKLVSPWKESPDAKEEKSNSLFAKTLHSSMMRKKNDRSSLFQMASKQLKTHDMKENAPRTKSDQIDNVTATKTLAKRRALEDLPNN